MTRSARSSSATAVPFAEIAVNLAFVAVTTRVLFAQAFDRLLPVSVAKVSERNQSPWVAIIIVLIIAIGFCFLEVYVNLSNIVALESLFFALVLLAGGIAATFLPITRADLVKRAGADRRQADRRDPGDHADRRGDNRAGDVRDRPARRSNRACTASSTRSRSITLAVVLLAGPVIYAIARDWSDVSETRST